MTAKFATSAAHGDCLFTTSNAARRIFAVLSQLGFDPRPVSASEVVQLINEQAPSVVALEVGRQVRSEMISGKRKREAERVSDDDLRLFRACVPLVVLDGIARFPQGSKVPLVVGAQRDAANAFQPRNRGIDRNSTGLQTGVLVDILPNEGGVDSPKALFQEQLDRGSGIGNGVFQPRIVSRNVLPSEQLDGVSERVSRISQEIESNIRRRAHKFSIWPYITSRSLYRIYP